MTAEEAYDLYKTFHNAHTRYTTEHPKGEGVMPDQEFGRTDYKFYGSEALATFLNFVLEQKK